MEILKVGKGKIDCSYIKQAAEIIKNGGLVIFPTETVYGIGVDAFNTNAVERVFRLKGRKFTNPLTLHLADKADIEKVAREIPDAAQRAIDKFLPGPLTIILKKKKNIPDIVTAGRQTVGIRVPSHEVASRLIALSVTYIAAPSANLSGGKSPGIIGEIPEQVLKGVDLVIDAGPAEFGVHSTIIDFTLEPPVILREGSFSKESLKKILQA